MAHLAASYSSYETFLQGADSYWSLDLAAMNNSGVTGTAILAINTEADGTRYLNVSMVAEGLTPSVQHAQHVHGTFDPDTGEVTDARMPVTADDADMDGFVEVFEGLAAYGDILFRHSVLDESECILAFEVADTGVGIAPDKQEIVFEAFQQVVQLCSNGRLHRLRYSAGPTSSTRS